MLDIGVGEGIKKTLQRERGQVRGFYAAAPSPVPVGFLGFFGLFERLGITVALWGDRAEIREAETLEQGHDRRECRETAGKTDRSGREAEKNK